jgi:hypothetical protein
MGFIEESKKMKMIHSNTDLTVVVSGWADPNCHLGIFDLGFAEWSSYFNLSIAVTTAPL